MSKLNLNNGIIVSLDPLYRIILTWDFNKDLYDDKFSNIETEERLLKKSLIASVNKQSYKNVDEIVVPITDNYSFPLNKLKVMNIQNEFQTENDYIEYFFPLFLLETKQIIFHAKQTELSELEVILQVSVKSTDEFVYLVGKRFVQSDLRNIVANDLCVLYSKQSVKSLISNNIVFVGNNDNKNNVDGIQVSDDDCHLLVLVENYDTDQVTLKLFIPSNLSHDNMLYARYPYIINKLTSLNPTWHLKRILGMATINREYHALFSIFDLPLKDIILKKNTEMSYHPNATNVARTDSKLKISTHLKTILKNIYNVSQLDALENCLKISGVTLIQGPPGTGKTTTIIGILSVILASSVENTPDLNANSYIKDFTLKNKLNRVPLYIAQPWMMGSKYVPWYDTISLSYDDLQNHKLTSDTSEVTQINLKKLSDIDKPKHILVCAPSNAACDEILKKLILDPFLGGGLIHSDGTRYTPSVVRMGPNINSELSSYSFEEKYSNRLNLVSNSSFVVSENIKNSIIEESSIVCSTLSICGSYDILRCNRLFDTVIIDEASQGVELSTLIPLKLGCKRLILVGDPQQLPATVFSRIAINNNYNQSLFERLQKSGYKINMLSEQYRMHPKISEYPSIRFYKNQLLNAPNLSITINPPIPWYNITIFQPVYFFNLNSESTKDNTSYINTHEALLVCQLIYIIKSILTEIQSFKTEWYKSISIITPYSGQVILIRKMINTLFQNITIKPCLLDVNTIDSFQGRENDIIIFSTVRSEYMNKQEDKDNHKHKNIGFLSDLRRINVALTRARHNLFIVGNYNYLCYNPEWKHYIEYLRSHSLIIEVDSQSGNFNNFIIDNLEKQLNSDMTVRNVFLEHVPKFIENIDNIKNTFQKYIFHQPKN